MFQRLALVFLSGASLANGVHAQDLKATNELIGKLQGYWMVVDVMSDGKKIPPTSAFAKGFDFQGRKLVAIGHDGDKFEDSFVIDISHTPKWFDSTPATGPDRGKPILGIIELQDGTLKICSAGNPGAARPKDFAAAQSQCYVLRRKLDAAQMSNKMITDLVPPALIESDQHVDVLSSLEKFSKKAVGADALEGPTQRMIEAVAESEFDESRDQGLAALLPAGKIAAKLIDERVLKLNDKIVELGKRNGFFAAAKLQKAEGQLSAWAAVIRHAQLPPEDLMKVGSKLYAEWSSPERMRKGRNFLLGEYALMLSKAARETGETKEAERYARDALAHFKKHPDLTHDQCARVLIELAILHRDKKDMDMARTCADSAVRHLAPLLQKRTERLGKDHVLTIAVQRRIDAVQKEWKANK